MKILKKITAFFVCLPIMLMVSACGEENEYEHLKTDIVGMWMDEGGPSVEDNQIFGKSLVFYEFTSDNKIYYHYVNNTLQPGTISDAAQEGGLYHFEDNIFVFDANNTGALVTIEGDTLIMSNNTEETRYTRVSVADAAGYSLVYKDTGLLREQNILMYGEEYVLYSESEAASLSEEAAEAELSASESSTDTSAPEDEESGGTVPSEETISESTAEGE